MSASKLCLSPDAADPGSTTLSHSVRSTQRKFAMFKPIMRAGLAGFAALVFALPWGAAHAVGTVAGTSITNNATATFSIGGAPQTAVTNAVTVRVDEIIRVAVTPPGAPTPVIANDQNKALKFVVTNTGNGQEVFNLVVNRALAGDTFDPAVGAAGSLFADTNGNGVYDAADVAVPLVAGVPQVTLAPDTPTTYFVVSNIPAGPFSNGNTGNVSLTALSATAGAVTAGAGNPVGTVLTNLGTPSVGGGTIDAVIGAGVGGAADSGADDVVTSSYIVASVTVTVNKVVLSVTSPTGVNSGPCNVAIPPAGCSAIVPGSVIEYLVTATITGNATAAATAQSVTVSDSVPANTTWVANSIRATANGSAPGALAAKTDAVDALPDNASCAACGNATGTMIANFGDVTVAAAAAPIVHQVAYKVSVN